MVYYEKRVNNNSNFRMVIQMSVDGYHTAYADNIVAYFKGYLDIANDDVESKKGIVLPLIGDWATEIGKTKTEIQKWASDHEDFRIAVEKATQIIESILVKQALQGKYNAAFAAIAAKNLCGWVDKHEVNETKEIHITVVERFDGGQKVISEGVMGRIGDAEYSEVDSGPDTVI